MTISPVAEAHIGFLFVNGSRSSNRAIGHYHYDLIVRLQNNYVHHFQVKFSASNGNYKLGNLDKSAVEKMDKQHGVSPFGAHLDGRLYAMIADTVFRLPTYLARLKMADTGQKIEPRESIGGLIISKQRVPFVTSVEFGQIYFYLQTTRFQDKSEWDEFKTRKTPVPLIEMVKLPNEELAAARCFSLNGDYNAPTVIQDTPSV